MLMPAMQWLFPPHCIAADMDEISISFWIQSGPDWHPGFYQNEGPQMTLAFGMDFHINLPGREPGPPQLSVRPDNFQNLWTFVEWTRNQHWHCKLSYGSWFLSRLETFSIEPMFGKRKVPLVAEFQGELHQVGSGMRAGQALYDGLYVVGASQWICGRHGSKQPGLSWSGTEVPQFCVEVFWFCQIQTNHQSSFVSHFFPHFSHPMEMETLLFFYLIKQVLTPMIDPCDPKKKAMWRSQRLSLSLPGHGFASFKGDQGQHKQCQYGECFQHRFFTLAAIHMLFFLELITAAESENIHIHLSRDQALFSWWTRSRLSNSFTSLIPI